MCSRMKRKGIVHVIDDTTESLLNRVYEALRIAREVRIFLLSGPQPEQPDTTDKKCVAEGWLARTSERLQLADEKVSTLIGYLIDIRNEGCTETPRVQQTEEIHDESIQIFQRIETLQGLSRDH